MVISHLPRIAVESDCGVALAKEVIKKEKQMRKLILPKIFFIYFADLIFDQSTAKKSNSCKFLREDKLPGSQRKSFFKKILQKTCILHLYTL
jgi:hypothetical protein